MPKIMKRKPPPHVLVVDTSVLWHKDKAHVVCPEFEDAVAVVENDERSQAIRTVLSLFSSSSADLPCGRSPR